MNKCDPLQLKKLKDSIDSGEIEGMSNAKQMDTWILTADYTYNGKTFNLLFTDSPERVEPERSRFDIDQLWELTKLHINDFVPETGTYHDTLFTEASCKPTRKINHFAGTRDGLPVGKRKRR